MTPSLDSLQVLEVLLRTASPSVAASELGITQSAVSHALAKLRHELRDRLLVRRGDRMLLTPRGERLAKPLGVALDTLRRLVQDDERKPGPTVVNIAMRDQFVVSLGPALVSRLATADAKHELRVSVYDRQRVADALARGDIDLAIGVDPPLAPTLCTRALYREHLVCLTTSETPPTVDEYFAARHVVTTAHAGYSGGIDEAVASLGRSRTVAARVPYFTAALQLAASAGLFATVPSRIANAHHSTALRLHPVPFPARGFKVSLVWDARFDNDRANRWLRAIVIDAARVDAAGPPGARALQARAVDGRPPIACARKRRRRSSPS